MTAPLLPLRLVLGLIFCVHGYLKLLSRRYGPATFARYLEGQGVTPAGPVAYLIGGLELIGGACLAAGLVGRLAAVALAIHVLLALVITGPRKGFTRLPDAGYEYELLLLAGLLALALSAPTPYSLDHYLAR